MILFLLIAAGYLVVAARPVAATSVRLLSLDELVQRAERVFAGRCVEVRETRNDFGQPINEFTFTIIEPVKGVSGDEVTIRQIGGQRGIVPGYAVGQEVLLFLHPESRAGLTSPVGLGQGRFTIVRQGSNGDAAIAIGDGTRAGRRALSRAMVSPGGSKPASMVPITDSQRSEERGIALAPLIRAARRIAAEGAR